MHRLKRWHFCRKRRRNSSLYIVNDPFTFIPLFKRASPPPLPTIATEILRCSVRSWKGAWNILDRRRMRRKSRENLEIVYLGKRRRDILNFGPWKTRNEMETKITNVTVIELQTFYCLVLFRSNENNLSLNRSLQFLNFKLITTRLINWAWLSESNLFISSTCLYKHVEYILFRFISKSIPAERERDKEKYISLKKCGKNCIFLEIRIFVYVYFGSFFRN